MGTETPRTLARSRAAPPRTRVSGVYLVYGIAHGQRVRAATDRMVRATSPDSGDGRYLSAQAWRRRKARRPLILPAQKRGHVERDERSSPFTSIDS